MKFKVRLALAASILAFVGTFAQAEAVIIKVVNILPDSAGLPWLAGLKKMANEWVRISKGQVVISFVSANSESEITIAQKLNAREYDGAVFDQIGLSSINPDSISFSTPALIQTEAELDYILKNGKDGVNDSYAKRGFKIVAWTKLGWMRFFTKVPVRTADEMKKLKLASDNGQVKFMEALNAYGYKTVALSQDQYGRGISTGLVDAFYTSPILALSNGWDKIGNMTDFRIAPLIGGMVFTKEAWEKIPQEYRQAFMDTVAKIEVEINDKVVKAEAQAIDSMKKLDKLNVVTLTSAEQDNWMNDFIKHTESFLGSILPREVYDAIFNKLKVLRGK